MTINIQAREGGIDYSAVSRSRKRLQIKLDQDEELSKKYNAIFEKLSECQD